MKRIGGITLFMLGVALFIYFGVWIMGLQAILLMVKGATENKGTFYILFQILKIFFGFPLVEIVTGAMVLVGMENYKTVQEAKRS